MSTSESRSRVPAETGTSPIPVVNSHNDWSPLEEIIVGTPFHLDYANDVSFRLFFHDNIVKELAYSDDGNPWVIFSQVKPSNRVRDEAEEDLDDFIALLNAEGVSVRRPDPLPKVKHVTTPHWSAGMAHAMMSRDLFIVIGNEIIETAPMLRSRYFEGDLYKELFTDYFERGGKWTVAPRSRLLEKNFDFSYAVRRGYRDETPTESFYEIMFDGPQIVRLGRDLLFNCSTENHRMGLRWLQRHLGNEYRVHEISIADHHIDAKLVALRPGTFLVERGLDLSVLPGPLQKWNAIWYEPLDDGLTESPLPILASQSIGMNVLSLDEESVIVQDIQVPLIKSLERSGFAPIPCRWRWGRTLGGGFHCMTLDIRRRSVLEDYFA